MPTNQELIEQNIRVLIGDLQLQLVFARAQIATMETTIAEVMAKAKQAEVQAEDERQRADGLLDTLDKYQTAPKAKAKANGAGDTGTPVE